MDITKRIFELRDEGYRDFQSKLIPTVEKDRIIGVRLPQLKKLAKEFYREAERGEFLEALPHYYYDENQLHAILLSIEKDYDTAIANTEKFLPYVDNWATCDTIIPKVFRKHKNELLPYITKWIESGETYTVRFAVGLLMRFFLDEDFSPEYPETVSKIRSDEYYVNMMTAWYFATALAKQYDAALPYIENEKLDKWTHNKAIQKACESYRVSDEHKEHLRGLKRK